MEPAYADVIECPGSEVHGNAILLDKEAEAKMDRQEGAGFVYEKKAVDLEAYDGRKLKASTYSYMQQRTFRASGTRRMRIFAILKNNKLLSLA